MMDARWAPMTDMGNKCVFLPISTLFSPSQHFSPHLNTFLPTSTQEQTTSSHGPPYPHLLRNRPPSHLLRDQQRHIPPPPAPEPAALGFSPLTCSWTGCPPLTSSGTSFPGPPLTFSGTGCPDSHTPLTRSGTGLPLTRPGTGPPLTCSGIGIPIGAAPSQSRASLTAAAAEPFGSAKAAADPFGAGSAAAAAAEAPTAAAGGGGLPP